MSLLGWALQFWAHIPLSCRIGFGSPWASKPRIRRHEALQCCWATIALVVGSTIWHRCIWPWVWTIFILDYRAWWSWQSVLWKPGSHRFWPHRERWRYRGLLVRGWFCLSWARHSLIVPNRRSSFLRVAICRGYSYKGPNPRNTDSKLSSCVHNRKAFYLFAVLHCHEILSTWYVLLDSCFQPPGALWPRTHISEMHLLFCRVISCWDILRSRCRYPWKSNLSLNIGTAHCLSLSSLKIWPRTTRGGWGLWGCPRSRGLEFGGAFRGSGAGSRGRWHRNPCLKDFGKIQGNSQQSSSSRLWGSLFGNLEEMSGPTEAATQRLRIYDSFI